MSTEKKTLPLLNSDKDAERFISEADLSEYHLSNFTPLRDNLLTQDPIEKKYRLPPIDSILQDIDNTCKIEMENKKDSLILINYLRLAVGQKLQNR